MMKSVHLFMIYFINDFVLDDSINVNKMLEMSKSVTCPFNIAYKEAHDDISQFGTV